MCFSRTGKDKIPLVLIPPRAVPADRGAWKVLAWIQPAKPFSDESQNLDRGAPPIVES